MMAAGMFFIVFVFGAALGAAAFYGALAVLWLVMRGLARLGDWHNGRRRP